jgi:hypothetical protein
LEERVSRQGTRSTQAASRNQKPINNTANEPAFVKTTVDRLRMNANWVIRRFALARKSFGQGWSSRFKPSADINQLTEKCF